MRRISKMAVVASAAALVLAACGGGSDDEGSTASEKGGWCPAGGKGPKVGLAYDIGGRGDKSFNDLAAAAVKKASEELDATCQESSAVDGEPDSAKEERLRTLADAGFNPIVAVGFVYSEEVQTVAKEYPDVKFSVVDGFAEGDNVTNLVFTPEQGSYLVGAAAGLKTKTNTVGFVGGVHGPIIDPFLAGFQAGVKKTNPGAKVEVKWLSDQADQKAFNNAPGGKTAATALFDAGADIVFHAAGGSGAGVFEAATAEGDGKWAIGVDSDQWLSAPADQQPHILTSALKRVDVAVFDFITAFTENKTVAGFDTYDLKRDGVGYATSGGFVDDIKPQLEDLKSQIVSGSITVPNKL